VCGGGVEEQAGKVKGGSLGVRKEVGKGEVSEVGKGEVSEVGKGEVSEVGKCVGRMVQIFLLAHEVVKLWDKRLSWKNRKQPGVGKSRRKTMITIARAVKTMITIARAVMTTI
jgi:hypothetical protein